MESGKFEIKESSGLKSDEGLFSAYQDGPLNSVSPRGEEHFSHGVETEGPKETTMTQSRSLIIPLIHSWETFMIQSITFQKTSSFNTVALGVVFLRQEFCGTYSKCRFYTLGKL
jgi:hypothetical protein